MRMRKHQGLWAFLERKHNFELPLHIQMLLQNLVARQELYQSDKTWLQAVNMLNTQPGSILSTVGLFASHSQQSSKEQLAGKQS